MPDHAHFLVMSLRENSDQSQAMRFFRRRWKLLLETLPGSYELDRQPYDHVLRTAERERDAFQKIATYILENPVRAELAERREDWPFSGSLLPGYPSLDPHAENFWTSFWLAYDAVVP